MMQKGPSVPAGTIETFGFWSRTPLSDCQHFVLGYFREVPAGLDFL
jgi:hypothetical protein